MPPDEGLPLEVVTAILLEMRRLSAEGWLERRQVELALRRVARKAVLAADVTHRPQSGIPFARKEMSPDSVGRDAGMSRTGLEPGYPLFRRE